jgi:hypothetical protein
VVGDVEEIGSEFEIFGLCEIGPLQDAHVEVIDSRTATQRALGIRNLAKQLIGERFRVLAENVRIEVLV